MVRVTEEQEEGHVSSLPGDHAERSSPRESDSHDPNNHTSLEFSQDILNFCVDEIGPKTYGDETMTREQGQVSNERLLRQEPASRALPDTHVVQEQETNMDSDKSYINVKTSFDARQYFLPESESLTEGDADMKQPFQNVSEGSDENLADKQPPQTDAKKDSLDLNRNQFADVAEKRKNFEKLQDHIDSLTMENMDLAMCLQQQTNIVQRLTQENESMVKRLNDAAMQQEALSESSKQCEIKERHMQKQIRMLEKQLDAKEKESRDLSSKVRVLGSELIMLEEKLLREKNERLKRESTSGGDHRESESQLLREIQSHNRDNEMLQSTMIQLQEELDNTRKLLRKSELERQNAIESQRKLEEDLQAAMKHQRHPPLPKSALISASPMESNAQEQIESASSIPSEIKAMLPVQTWIPGVEDVQDDINSIAGRVYNLLEILEKKVESKGSIPSQAVDSI